MVDQQQDGLIVRLSDEAGKLGRIGYFLMIDFLNHIAPLQAGLCRQAAGRHSIHYNTVGVCGQT